MDEELGKWTIAGLNIVGSLSLVVGGLAAAIGLIEVLGASGSYDADIQRAGGWALTAVGASAVVSGLLFIAIAVAIQLLRDHRTLLGQVADNTAVLNRI